MEQGRKTNHCREQLRPEDFIDDKVSMRLQKEPY